MYMRMAALPAVRASEEYYFAFATGALKSKSSRCDP
jgi:hypothetical protein